MTNYKNMKCKECGFEIEEKTAVTHGCLKCGDTSLIDKERQIEISNKYVTNKKDICYKGKCQGLKAWAIDLGISYNTLNTRKWKGLSVEEILKK